MSKYELENASKFFEQFDENTKKEFAIDGFMVEISTIFIKYRVKNNISQRALAKRLGISQAMVSKLESGDYNPSIRLLCESFQKLGLEMKLVVSEPQSDEMIGMCDLMKG